MRNVEIKANVRNFNNLLEKAKEVSGKDGEIIKQTDVFFHVKQGRLKLRQFEDGSGELIYYDRPDTSGPKLSSYEKSNINRENVAGMQAVLGQALGIKITIKKIRYLFLVDQTRVHVDNVEGLGHFMELEVVLNDGQTPEEGEKIAFDLMDKLGVAKEDLISGAYADLLQK